MNDEFFELDADLEQIEPENLRIDRARGLARAVDQHPEFTLVDCHRRTVDGVVTTEVLVVDIQHEGVPPKNPIGIRYRERLALSVSADRARLVDVAALRRGFPVLIHQMNSVPGQPPSLCLYYEPPAAVARSWTPQRFLAKLCWWLRGSARGDLHPADQPVEQLFFNSRYDLVLPVDFEGIASQAVGLQITRAPTRPGGGTTFFLERAGAEQQAGQAVVIALWLPPVVQGPVEGDPDTLGGLADLLLARGGVGLLRALQDAVRARVPTGTPAQPRSTQPAAPPQHVVILVQVPIRRTAESEPESASRRAFVLNHSLIDLGLATGALMKHEGKVFPDLLQPPPSDAWRALEVWPVNVLQIADAAAHRRYSGTVTEGPAGVLIGAGALGSAMLSMWDRAGWGRWTVIDGDHVKPHNLSRHTATLRQLGLSKAEAVAELHREVVPAGSELKAISREVTDPRAPWVAEAFASSTVVVDVSTTLEYPRAVSSLNEAPRHVSVFITPDANSGVLLVEDAERRTRLRTLEAQYYRALITEDWGKDHLAKASTFWSGAGCRDISVVMPYSSVMTHASNLAQQIPQHLDRAEAAIRVWRRDPAQGSVDVHAVPVEAEDVISLEVLDLYLDAGVERELRTWRNAAAPRETGGVLLGYVDFNVGAIVIVRALPAPADSTSASEFFERGTKGLAAALQEASERTAGVVGYIGEWHSHPPGHSAHPSGQDRIQLAHLARQMGEEGMPVVQLIVGETDLRASLGLAV
jgi:integrative and conjugative element protein (TIGR02256 family)